VAAVGFAEPEYTAAGILTGRAGRAISLGVTGRTKSLGVTGRLAACREVVAAGVPGRDICREYKVHIICRIFQIIEARCYQ